MVTVTKEGNHKNEETKQDTATVQSHGLGQVRQESKKRRQETLPHASVVVAVRLTVGVDMGQSYSTTNRPASTS